MDNNSNIGKFIRSSLLPELTGRVMCLRSIYILYMIPAGNFLSFYYTADIATSMHVMKAAMQMEIHRHLFHSVKQLHKPLLQCL